MAETGNEKVPTIHIFNIYIYYTIKARDRCYDFKNIFAEKFGKNLRFMYSQTTATSLQKLLNLTLNQELL
jgi:hypothetical protein